jgi:hypothetical protein
VLSSRYATTGRSGSDLLRDDEGRAPQRRATGDSKEYYRSRTQRTEPRGPGRLTRYAIGTTARPHLGILHSAHIGTGPRARSYGTRSARQRYPSGRAGLSSGSVRRRTRRRTEAGGPCGATGRDLILQRKHANVPSEDMGPCACPKIAAFECATCKHSKLAVGRAERINRTASSAREFRRYRQFIVGSFSCAF